MVNIQDIEGNTALHYAAFYFSGNGEVFMPVFETLCDKDANTSIRNNQGETPLHNMLAIAEGAINKQVMSLLLAHGAKVNDIDDAGNTPLRIAARRLDNHGMIDFLIGQGVDTTIGNSNDDTPVHIAVSGHVSALGLAEKLEIQDGVLATLTNAGGNGLMGLANAEGKTPREICQAQRDQWRKDEDRELVISRRRGRNLTIAAPCSFI